MPFLSISLYNFRNLENQTIDISAPEIFLVGKNGQGKTNLLEALYLASYGNSFRTRNESEIYKKNTDEYSIRVLFKEHEQHSHRISVISKDKKKILEKNLKRITDRKEFISTIPCILFCHDDLDFAIGAPERRRFFIDQSLSLYDSSYIDLLRNFTKLLKSRNVLLKEKKLDILDTLDIQFIPLGLQIIQKRQELIDSFNTVFSRLYEEISGIDSVVLDYSPSWKHNTFDELLVSLIEKRQLDLAMNTSMSGPHRDKIRFIRNKKPFVQTASTGQRRLLSLILRAAQAYFYTQTTKRLPILLMDDVLLELDTDKRTKFTELLPQYDQLICTFLPGEPYRNYKREKTCVYIVSEGTFHAE
ncbi:MAG: DNA replication and repair protein RecF [Treponema sp.]